MNRFLTKKGLPLVLDVNETGSGTLRIGSLDLSNQVRAVTIHAAVGDITTVELEFFPGGLNISALGLVLTEEDAS